MAGKRGWQPLIRRAGRLVDENGVRVVARIQAAMDFVRSHGTRVEGQIEHCLES